MLSMLSSQIQAHLPTAVRRGSCILLSAERPPAKTPLSPFADTYSMSNSMSDYSKRIIVKSIAVELADSGVQAFLDHAPRILFAGWPGPC